MAEHHLELSPSLFLWTIVISNKTGHFQIFSLWFQESLVVHCWFVPSLSSEFRLSSVFVFPRFELYMRRKSDCSAFTKRGYIFQINFGINLINVTNAETNSETLKAPKLQNPSFRPNGFGFRVELWPRKGTHWWWRTPWLWQRGGDTPEGEASVHIIFGSSSLDSSIYANFASQACSTVLRGLPKKFSFYGTQYFCLQTLMKPCKCL